MLDRGVQRPCAPEWPSVGNGSGGPILRDIDYPVQETRYLGNNGTRSDIWWAVEDSNL